jgi:hypothetical protein
MEKNLWFCTVNIGSKRFTGFVNISMLTDQTPKMPQPGHNFNVFHCQIYYLAKIKT